MDLEKAARAFGTYLRQQTPPVALKLAASAAEIPEKARLPQRDLGTRLALCQSIALARRYGWVIGLPLVPWRHAL